MTTAARAERAAAPVQPAAAVDAILRLTIRGLLNRRRNVFLVLLALGPVAIALLIRVAGRPPDPVRLELAILDGLIVRTVLPLVALVLGTAAVGPELDDGTAVYLLAKPIPRWTVVVAKVTAAAGLCAALVAPSTLVTGLILAGDQTNGAAVAIAYGVASCVGALIYSAVFVAASIATGRALVGGLVYTLLWEGVLAGLFVGSRTFSIREYTVGVAGLLAPGAVHPELDGLTTVLMTTLVLAAAVGLATRWLRGYQVRSAE
jgi:ABC-2 type transport system permease protein